MRVTTEPSDGTERVSSSPQTNESYWTLSVLTTGLLSAYGCAGWMLLAYFAYPNPERTLLFFVLGLGCLLLAVPVIMILVWLKTSREVTA